MHRKHIHDPGTGFPIVDGAPERAEDNPHTHEDGGAGPAVFPTGLDKVEKNQHFHIDGGAGSAIWTGPRWPNFVYADSSLTPPED
jgi:hypothetical protein